MKESLELQDTKGPVLSAYLPHGSMEEKQDSPYSIWHHSNEERNLVPAVYLDFLGHLGNKDSNTRLLKGLYLPVWVFIFIMFYYC
jgi:hypothetical protein